MGKFSWEKFEKKNLIFSTIKQVKKKKKAQNTRQQQPTAVLGKIFGPIHK